ncbi:MAG: hypothetical protein FWD47_14780 [Treponema sp.]|nr:hypothetical protein [Treponema sp.]
MDCKKLLIELYNANNAEELHKIVLNNEILANQDNWKPYGGQQNNAGTFENQQSKPEAALVEKITNSIDAILTKKCISLGMIPDDNSNPNLPRTMKDAVQLFFNVPKGNWENTSPTQRRDIAQDLQLIVSGDKSTPNIAVYDNGEGQNAGDFEQTFLSLHKGNKINIPFVQGKFNMGSTGAVVFCGEDKKYQLIVSRRCNDLGNSDSKIGFTLVRKHILTDEEETTVKSTWYEFFTLNGIVPSFECESIDFGLNDTPFIDGTIVKMYSYQLSPGCRSDATLDLWRELNSLLYETSVPILIVEKRFTAGHSNTKPMLGNKARISIDDRDKRYLHKSFSINNLNDFGAEIPIEVTIFKPDSQGSEFVRRRPVIFLRNGQAHGVENKTFVSADLGLRQIKNHIIISVDCSNIKTSAANSLFMASRDRMLEGRHYEILKNEIIQLLKNDEDLKNANQEFKGAIVRESKDDKELIENLFSTLKSNKDIKNLLDGMKGDFTFFNKQNTTSGTREQSKKDNPVGKPEKAFKRFPSIFKLKGTQSVDEKKYKAINKGGRGKIRFETDVENDFLTRNEEPGSFEISILDFGNGSGGGGGGGQMNTIKDKLKVQRSGPFNGEIELVIEPDREANVGDIIPLSVNLISCDGVHEVVVNIKIEKEITQNKQETNKSKEEPDFSLPKAIRVFKDKIDGDEDTAIWVEHDMTEKSIVGLQLGDDFSIEAILVNMDSNLMKKLVNQRSANVEIISKKYLSSIYAHSLILYSTLIGYYSNDSLDFDERTIKEIKDNMEETLKFIFQYYGGFLLSFDSELNSD